MTTGNVLYLAMSIGMFALFSVVLAYQSWQQSRVPPKVASTTQPEPYRAISA